jgi:APA family basic amino acid/polyamine antiporter
VTPLAVAALLAFVVLQWGGIRVSSRFQEVATAIKFTAFLALVSACLLVGRTGSADAAAPAPAPATFYGVIIALQSVVITYGGWQSALYFAEEDTDPSRNLPRSMIGGLASVIAIYVLVNVALLRVLPIPALAHATLPAADAAEVVTGRNGSRAIVVLSIVSLAPLLNAVMMIGTRIMYAMSRDGFLPQQAARVNAGGTPTVAISITTVVAVALIATGTFQKLIAVASFFLAANYFVCCLALVVLRRREPALARPFRAWGFPYSAAVVLAGAGAFLVSALVADTPNAVIAIALAGAGIIGHIIGRRALSRRF